MRPVATITVDTWYDSGENDSRRAGRSCDNSDDDASIRRQGVDQC